MMGTLDEAPSAGLEIETVKPDYSGGILVLYGLTATHKSGTVAGVCGAQNIPGQNPCEPKGVICDAENGLNYYPGTLVFRPRSENHLFEFGFKFGESTDPRHKIFAIDTLSQFYLNYVEPGILRRHGAESLASIPYGKGPPETLVFGKRLCDFGAYLASKQKWLVLICHAMVKGVNDPQIGSYDRFMPKLPLPLSELVCERADVVAFAYRSMITKKTHDGKQVAIDVGGGGSGGEYLLRTTPTATVTAKSRIAGGVDGPLPMAWSSLGVRV